MNFYVISETEKRKEKKRNETDREKAKRKGRESIVGTVGLVSVPLFVERLLTVSKRTHGNCITMGWILFWVL